MVGHTNTMHGQLVSYPTEPFALFELPKSTIRGKFKIIFEKFSRVSVKTWKRNFKQQIDGPEINENFMNRRILRL